MGVAQSELSRGWLDVVALPAANTGMTWFLIRRLVPLRNVSLLASPEPIRA